MIGGAASGPGPRLLWPLLLSCPWRLARPEPRPLQTARAIAPRARRRIAPIKGSRRPFYGEQPSGAYFAHSTRALTCPRSRLLLERGFFVLPSAFSEAARRPVSWNKATVLTFLGLHNQANASAVPRPSPDVPCRRNCARAVACLVHPRISRRDSRQSVCGSSIARSTAFTDRPATDHSASSPFARRTITSL